MKKPIILLVVLMFSIFSIVNFISAGVYQTPGTDTKCNCTWTEPPVCNETLVEDNLSNKLSPFGFIFAIVVIVGGLFLIIRRQILMKRKKKQGKEKVVINKEVVINNEGKEKNGMSTMAVDVNKYVKKELKEESEEEFEDLIKEIGLEDMINKKGEIKYDENNDRDFKQDEKR